MASTDLVPSGTVRGTDLVVPSSGGSVADLKYALANGLRLFVDEEGMDEDAFLLRQLDKGTDEATILGDNALTAVDSILNVPVRITAYHGMRNSSFQESKLGVFVVIDVTDADGTTYTVAGGSADVVTKVVQLAEVGAIPQKGWSVFEKSAKPTTAGFYPINLKAAADPTGF